MVPKLKQAWKIGMMLRPDTRSFAAPETFIETSVIENAAPKTASPANTAAKLGPTVANTPANANPIGPSVRHQAMVRAAPNRAMMCPEASSPRIEPAASPKISMPICSVLAPSESRTAGTRAIQLAMPMPHSPKIAKVALRQASTSWRVRPPG